MAKSSSDNNVCRVEGPAPAGNVAREAAVPPAVQHRSAASSAGWPHDGAAPSEGMRAAADWVSRAAPSEGMRAAAERVSIADSVVNAAGALRGVAEALRCRAALDGDDMLDVLAAVVDDQADTLRDAVARRRRRHAANVPRDLAPSGVTEGPDPPVTPQQCGALPASCARKSILPDEFSADQ